MNDILLLYLFTRLDVIKTLLILCLLSIPLLYVFFGIVGNNEVIYGPFKRLVCLWIFCLLGFVLIPTQKDVMFIVGGKLAIDIAQSPETKETAGKLYQLLQKKLDAELKDSTVNKPQEK